MEPVVGVDTGGTFTDFVVLDAEGLRIHKVPSTPQDPSAAVEQGFRDLGLPDKVLVIHGTTVGTNALLERRGGRIVLLTTAGFEDVLSIGRQTRERLYDLFYRRPPDLVPPERRIGVRERIGPDGTIVIPLTADEVERVRRRVRSHDPEAVAVVFLFSYVNSSHEQVVRAGLADLGVPVFLSSEVFPEYREYERTVVTVLNAYLAPVMQGYLRRLQAWVGGRLWVMTSTGGTVPAERAVREPIQTLLSGPAAGVLGAWFLARRAGFDRLITLDMGGTSTDVSLIDGDVTVTRDVDLGGLPIRVPMIDVQSIGAGGGSIVWVDAGGALRVGPQSAGADPGPVCYGRGGQEVTVTDAHLFLGRIHPSLFLAGRMRLYPELAEAALRRMAAHLSLSPEALAEGIVEVANAGMERALRVVSVERGYDPRDFVLFAFGGAGGLHACTLAARLGIRTVVNPPHAGIVSALGALVAEPIWTHSQSLLVREDEVDDAVLRQVVGRLVEQGVAVLRREAVLTEGVRVTPFLQMRYLGQSYELLVPFRGDLQATLAVFQEMHRQRYGFERVDRPREVVGVHVRLTVPAAQPEVPTLPWDPDSERVARLGETSLVHEGHRHRVRLYDRSALRAGAVLEGPAVVFEATATFFLPPNWKARVDPSGHLIARPV
ncbi:MAG: hydantoinase/oxoprolinase family protein [Acidobacteria bacterium]|nr:hydantoinase/oxoprolinase family protein [Acidobacteriota bacterium]MDW7984047.1 hydantoinase/oxoprolinase family protein [Acidobacteriota bacterium]